MCDNAFISSIINMLIANLSIHNDIMLNWKENPDLMFGQNSFHNNLSFTYDFNELNTFILISLFGSSVCWVQKGPFNQVKQNGVLASKFKFKLSWPLWSVDRLEMKTTSNGRWPKNIKRETLVTGRF